MARRTTEKGEKRRPTWTRCICPTCFSDHGVRAIVKGDGYGYRCPLCKTSGFIYEPEGKIAFDAMQELLESREFRAALLASLAPAMRRLARNRGVSPREKRSAWWP